MLGVRVAGGTKAGRKRPLRERAGAWLCACLCNPREAELKAEPGVQDVFKTQPGYLLRCTDCGERRPA